MKTSAAAAPLAYAATPPQYQSYVRPPVAANDNGPLIIDLFAGGGGASEGILQATGRHPDIAVNHDEEAIALHEHNHPITTHVCENIKKVDIKELLAKFGNRIVALLWASPDCKHHSKARGGKPKDKNIRGLAWEVLRWSAAIKKATGHLPQMIALENVEEFQDWGPLTRSGRVRKDRMGETFRLWVSHLRGLGFKRIEWREIVAAEFGVPTTRKRLYLVALADDMGQDWPKATHAADPKPVKAGNAKKPASQQLDLFGPPQFASTPVDIPLLRFRSAAECIMWDLPIPSIFGRKKGLKPKTHARIYKGIKKYVIERSMSRRPFLVKVTHTKSTDAAQDLDDPAMTVTTAKGGEFALVGASILPVTHAGSDERVYDPMDPKRTVTAAHRGEAAIAGAFLKPRYGERDGQEPRARDIEDSMPTPVPNGNGGDLVAVHLGRQFGTTTGQDLGDAHPTVMSDGGGGKSQLVSAHLVRQFGRSVGSDIDRPADAVMAKAKDAVAAVYMDQHNGDRIGRAADDPLTTTTHRGTQQKVVAAILDKYYGNVDCQGVDEALDTVTSVARFGLAAAYMEQANTGMTGHDMVEPVSTLVGKGCTQRLVTAFLEQVEAEDGLARRQVLEFLWEHAGEPTAEEWADPLATLEGRVKFGLVVVDGSIFQIVDIGMRMLEPRELYRAQGFSDDYEIKIMVNKVNKRGVMKRQMLTKTAQTRMAGNSVPPLCAKAMVQAFLPPILEKLERIAA